MQHFFGTTLKITFVTKSGVPKFEPGTAGWEAGVEPLCYAAPTLSDIMTEVPDLINKVFVKSGSLVRLNLPLDKFGCKILLLPGRGWGKFISPPPTGAEDESDFLSVRIRCPLLWRFLQIKLFHFNFFSFFFAKNRIKKFRLLLFLVSEISVRL